jgi:hypothetical protein
MKKLLLFILTLSQAYAQEKLTKGYYIDRNNQTKECFFDENRLIISSQKVKFKTNEEESFKEFLPTDLYEFGITGKFRYVSKIVEIDNSSNSLTNMSMTKEPENVIQNVFLKVLVQGDYELWKLETYDIEKFYLFKNELVTQLISKKFFHNGLIKENLYFKSQISKLLTCGVENEIVASTDYKEKDLIEIVSKHNQCSNSATNYTFNSKKESKVYFGFYLKGGMSLKQIRIESNDVYRSGFFETDFNNVTPNIAAELELVLPISFNRVSVFVEPSFFRLTNDNKDADNTSRQIKLNYFQLTFGSKFYFKEHTNGFFVYGALSFSKADSESSYDVNITGNSKLKFDVTTSMPAKLGFGYLYKNKIYADISYQTPARLFSNPDYMLGSTISSLGFQVGYKFL